MRIRVAVFYNPDSASEAVARDIADRAPSDFLVTPFACGSWRECLPAFFDIYEASDVVLVAGAIYRDGAGRFAGTLELPADRDHGRDGTLHEWIRAAAARLRAPRTDLSTEVTVFVTTVGGASYRACRELLRRQDCTFALDVIEDVAPLSAALQQMLDRCRTPFYVQVDEDMLLYPHAVRTLYDAMAAAARNVAVVVGQLYDVHLDRCIQGVKIARHESVRAYPWADEPNVIRRIERLEADGHAIVELPIPQGGDGALGLHSTHATPDALYDRYLTLERLRRAFPSRLQWFEPYPAIFLQRFLATGSERDLESLKGVIAGALAGPLPAGAEIRDAGRQPQHDLAAVRVAAGRPDR